MLNYSLKCLTQMNICVKYKYSCVKYKYSVVLNIIIHVCHPEEGIPGRGQVSHKVYPYCSDGHVPDEGAQE